ncbi:hypothetical protein POSPLADRAFT_1041918 [Postia placenta MAD-698-R-SB12]|uniref:Extracellular membrane protein CFEM domain-containing protein n=1 Tax=Postia placenta MAD-698-R-SB12 TaxID=670580 RepID=A0A1X6MKA0_9APHY|nr:hypothetical protein POSPLADRAFT_1041918 [Postia placenta MAD-698-R-SB12]OSX56676.1 hypothetical protein POSPLADRAFT_1041918 [Postia placenta MAD-698-R-SB12]
MYLLILAVYLLTTLQLVQLVQCRPSANAAVELSKCGESDTPQVLADQCVAVCRPVHDARDCNLTAACTCTVAPPAAVQACLQCLLDANTGYYPHEVAFMVPSSLSAYSELCGTAPISREATVNLSHSSADTNSTAVLKREVSDTHCIYGLPQVTVSSSASFIASQKRLWPLYCIIFLMI